MTYAPRVMPPSSLELDLRVMIEAIRSVVKYNNGFTLFAFDLTPDLDKGGYFHLVKQGNLRLELHFKTALTAIINVVVYAEFDNVIKIDKARNVLFDYSA